MIWTQKTYDNINIIIVIKIKMRYNLYKVNVTKENNYS